VSAGLVVRNRLPSCSTTAPCPRPTEPSARACTPACPGTASYWST